MILRKWQMANSNIKESALADLFILEDVVDFKMRFYHRGWAQYELAKPGTLKLVSHGHILETVRKDYKAMRNMIYGTYFDYDAIYQVFARLEDEINGCF